MKLDSVKLDNLLWSLSHLDLAEALFPSNRFIGLDFSLDELSYKEKVQREARFVDARIETCRIYPDIDLHLYNRSGPAPNTSMFFPNSTEFIGCRFYGTDQNHAIKAVESLLSSVHRVPDFVEFGSARQGYDMVKELLETRYKRTLVFDTAGGAVGRWVVPYIAGH